MRFLPDIYAPPPARRDPCFLETLNDNLFSKARVTPEVRVAAPAEIDKILPACWMQGQGKTGACNI